MKNKIFLITMIFFALVCTSSSRTRNSGKAGAPAPEAGQKESLGDRLRQAAHYGDLKLMKRLLKQGADINARSKGGSTPLIWASINGHEGAVRLLLARGALVNARTRGGTTALLVASSVGNLKIVRILLKAGANPKAATKKGQTPLGLARRAGHGEVEKLLLQALAGK